MMHGSEKSGLWVQNLAVLLCVVYRKIDLTPSKNAVPHGGRQLTECSIVFFSLSGRDCWWTEPPPVLLTLHVLTWHLCLFHCLPLFFACSHSTPDAPAPPDDGPKASTANDDDDSDDNSSDSDASFSDW